MKKERYRSDQFAVAQRASPFENLRQRKCIPGAPNLILVLIHNLSSEFRRLTSPSQIATFEQAMSDSLPSPYLNHCTSAHHAETPLESCISKKSPSSSFPSSSPGLTPCSTTVSITTTKSVDFKLAVFLELDDLKVIGPPANSSDAGPLICMDKVGKVCTWSSSLRETDAATTTGRLATMRLTQS
jgi:hypothetical protein